MTDDAETPNTTKKMESEYDLKLHEICTTISEKRYKTILLQFPEGLKNIACEAKDLIEEETNVQVMISADPCYGACDIPLISNYMKIDLLVQFGHAKIPTLEYSIPTMFIEAHSKLDVIPVVKKALDHLKGTVGLLTTAQHIHKLADVKNFLLERGFKAVIGEGRGRIAYKGQVLGCNISSATSITGEVECYLYIGSGNFHPIGVAIATGKPVVIADPYLVTIRDIEEEKNKLKRQRHGAIAKADNAKTLGILVGTKPGQTRLHLAYELKTLAEKHGKKAYVLVLHEFSSACLASFKLDAFVSTACPRIAIDDYMMYDIPILTPQELRIVLGEARWEDYTLDELI